MAEFNEHFLQWIKTKGGIVTRELEEEWQEMMKAPPLNEDESKEAEKSTLKGETNG